MKTSGDIDTTTTLAAKIVNASDVKRLYKIYQASDPYTKPIPERIRRKYVEETKTSSKTSTDRT